MNKHQMAMGALKSITERVRQSLGLRTVSLPRSCRRDWSSLEALEPRVLLNGVTDLVNIPLTNPGFESGIPFSQVSDWLRASNESWSIFNEDRYGASQGSRAASVNQSGWIWQDSGSALRADTTYAFSVDMRANSTTNTPGRQVLELYSGNPYDGGTRVADLFIPAASVTSAWQTFTLQYTSPMSGPEIGRNLWVRIIQGQATPNRYEYVLWDNVKLGYVPRPIVHVPLANPGFENGTLYSQVSNWSRASDEAWSIFNEDRYGASQGSRAASVNHSGRIWQNTGNAVLPDTAYVFSVDMRGSGSSNSPGDQELEIFAGDPNAGGTLVGSSLIPAAALTTAWQTFSLRYIAPASGAEIGQDLWLRVTQKRASPDRYEFVYWDNARLSYVRLGDDPQKKLIYFGNDLKAISTLAENVENLQNVPFDGLVIYTNWSYPFYSTGLGSADGTAALAQTIEWGRFTDNFMYLTAGKKVDWFDDALFADNGELMRNVRAVAQIGAAAGAKGMFFDPEFSYWGEENTWQYSIQDRRTSRTFAEFETIVRQRGKQIINAIEEFMPDTTFLTAFWGSFFQDRDFHTETDYYGLLSAFMSGILDGADAGTRIVDGDELSYYNSQQQHYLNGNKVIKDDALDIIPDDLKAKYHQQVESGHALFGDIISSAESMETRAYWAMDSADHYTWFFANTSSLYLNNVNVPAWSTAAINRATAKVALGRWDDTTGSTIVSTAPGTPDLQPVSDTGESSTDNVTTLDNTAGKTLQFAVPGTVAGATVMLYANGTFVGSAEASGSSTIVTTNGVFDLSDGVWSITASQTEPGKSQSSDSSSLSITVDTTAPAVTINRATSQANPTTVSPVHFTVVFSEVVNGFTGDDVTLGGTVGGNLIASVSGGPQTYNVAVSGMIGSGTIVASVAAGAAADIAGNLAPASNSTNNKVTYGVTHLYAEDFNDGQAEDFTVAAGSWVVNPSNRYLADAGSGEFALTVVELGGALPTGGIHIDSIIRGRTGGAAQNGFVVFDYVSLTDFKFAGLFFEVNEARIGHVSAGTWVIDAYAPVTIAINTDYQVSVITRNGNASLMLDGVPTVTHDYSGDLNIGKIGLGTRRAVAVFDDLVVYEAVLSSLPHFEDFNDGVADDFTVISGSWTINPSLRYLADAATDEFALSMLELSGTLPEAGFQIESIIRGKDVGSNKNGFIIFDYQGPGDFKFAGAFFGNNTWRIGQVSGGVFSNLSTVSESLALERDYVVSVIVQNGRATLIANGMQKLSHDFGGDLSDGKVGLGTRNARAVFDNVTIRALPGLPHHEDFNDGKADFLAVAVGTWSINDNKRYMAQVASAASNAIALLSLADPLPAAFAVNTIIRDPQVAGFNRNGMVIFDYVDANNFKYAGAFFGASQWRIGHVSNGQWFVDAFANQTLAAKTDHDVRIEIDGATVSLLGNGVLKTTFTFADGVNEGSVGLGTRGASAVFDDLLIEELV